MQLFSRCKFVQVAMYSPFSNHSSRALARILSTGPPSSIGASLPTCGVVSASNTTLISQHSPLPLAILLNSCGKTRRQLAVLGHIVVAVARRLLATILSAGIVQQEISRASMPTKSVVRLRAVLAMFTLETWIGLHQHVSLIYLGLIYLGILFVHVRTCTPAISNGPIGNESWPDCRYLVAMPNGMFIKLQIPRFSFQNSMTTLPKMMMLW